jgi:hypothetical protein
VSGALGQRAVLPPAGHPGVHQPRVARPAGVRPDPESLGDAGSVALQQHVGPLDQAQHGLDAGRVLQVGRDPAPTAQHRVRSIRGTQLEAAGRPVDANHLGAEVGQHHGRVRRGAEPGQLHHPQARQRSGHAVPPVLVSA